MTASAGRPDQGSRGTALYVYGIVRAGDDLGGLETATEGVGAGAPIELMSDGELAAIVGEVPLADFGQEVVMERIRDPAWLEEKVRAHEAVLEAVLPRAPLVPFRFGTVFTDEEQVRRMLREHDQLRTTLDELEGTFELGVKGFLEPDWVAVTTEPGEDEPASAGTSYLRRKQRDLRVAEARVESKLSLGAESHDVLAAAARDAVANPLQRPEATGRSGDMFLNGAYLVDAARESEFHKAFADLERRYAELATFELTGPWPPYNFVEAEGGL